MKGTEFMKQVRQNNTIYHSSEADSHNINLVEGFIQELRRKWYIMTIKKKVPQIFWDYVLRWISETSSLTHYTAAGGTYGGHTPLTQVTGETVNILEYLDF